MREKILISIEVGLREKVEKKIKPFGGKFSTYVEQLLKKGVEEK